jgi:hypothetical protein
MATSEPKAQQAVAPPAATAAYAVVRRHPKAWDVRAQGPEAVLVTDGHTVEVLGGGGLATSYARQAYHRFRSAGEPVATLQRLCGGSTYFHIDGPTVVAEPLAQLIGELAERYGLAPLNTIR